MSNVIPLTPAAQPLTRTPTPPFQSRQSVRTPDGIGIIQRQWINPVINTEAAWMVEVILDTKHGVRIYFAKECSA